MHVYVFTSDGQTCLAAYGAQPVPFATLAQKYPTGLIRAFETDQAPGVPQDKLRATIAGDTIAAVMVDPTWQPPAAPVDKLAELAELAEVVARNVAASPHDKRFLTQKEIGKQAISWIKAHPACTADEAEDYIMGLILAELPNQPVVTKLYWEWQGQPQGLAMSYLREAIDRGYTAPFVAAGVLPDPVPMTWESLVALIVATPEEQIAAWLRSL